MRTLFRNVRLKGKEEPVDFFVENGIFKEIEPNLQVQFDQQYDLRGNLAIPPYVVPHLHLDYVYMARAEGAKNETGTLFEGIQR